MPMACRLTHRRLGLGSRSLPCVADMVLVKELSRWRPYLSCGAIAGPQAGGARLWDILDAASIVGCNLPAVS